MSIEYRNIPVVQHGTQYYGERMVGVAEVQTNDDGDCVITINAVDKELISFIESGRLRAFVLSAAIERVYPDVPKEE